MTIPLERIRFFSALLWLSGNFGLGGTWCLRKNPWTPSTLTLVGERLKDDESSFEAAVFKGPAEPVDALLEGTAEPLDAGIDGLEAVLRGSAEPLSVSEEHWVNSASADTVPDFPEETCVFCTDPGPPEESTLSPFLIGQMFLREPSWKFSANLFGS